MPPQTRSHGSLNAARQPRAPGRDDSPEVVQRLLLDGESCEEDSDCSMSLSRDAIVLPWWFTEKDPDRLRAFMDYRDDAGRAALARVPDDVQWGEGRQFSVLCIDHGLPLQLWVVGVLQTVSYVACESGDYTGCDIAVRLLRDADRDALTMLAAKSRPVPRTPQVVFHASRPSVGHDSIKVFSHIYDATTTYCENTSMKRLTPADLVVGDIVLAEAKVVRHEAARLPGRAWSGWRVHFQLVSVSKLASRVVVKEERISNHFPLSL